MLKRLLFERARKWLLVGRRRIILAAFVGVLAGGALWEIVERIVRVALDMDPGQPCRRYTSRRRLCRLRFGRCAGGFRWGRRWCDGFFAIG